MLHKCKVDAHALGHDFSVVLTPGQVVDLDEVVGHVSRTVDGEAVIFAATLGDVTDPSWFEVVDSPEAPDVAPVDELEA